MTTIEREFASVYDALECAERPDSDEVLGGRTSRDASRDRWAGGTLEPCSYEQAIEFARNGYPSGTATLRQRLDTLPPSIRPNLRPTPIWGVSGSTVDMGRYLAGEPENMIDTARTRRQSLVLRIAIERAVSSNVPPADIEATGASVLAVIERLRTAGIAAELWATFTIRAKRSEDIYQARVKIQDASRPIDLDVLAFWIMHPAALRRISFAIEEQEARKVRKDFQFYIGGSYGTPITLNDGFDEYAPATAYEAESWIADVLARRAR